ncbi:nucleoside diphosphate phosphatase ENTPD5 [Ascaphus truei]|uniref:nucleoside diphosphate phosphatase ENTPD5 n=1 Tax=Ascaphus truei TaxID=8439 RepID=UPI003F595B6D
MNTFNRMYPFKTADKEDWDNPSSIDTAVSRLARTTIPLDDAASFRGPMDERIDGLHKRLYSTFGASLKPMVELASLGLRLPDKMGGLISAQLLVWIILSVSLIGCCSSNMDPRDDLKSVLPSAMGAQNATVTAVYGIMFDAGSTGTRIHIYSFKRCATGLHLELDGEVFESVKPGLSAFADQPKMVRERCRPRLWGGVRGLVQALGGVRGLMQAPGGEGLDAGPRG